MTKQYHLLHQHILLLISLPMFIIGCSSFDSSSDKIKRKPIDNTVANARVVLDWPGTYQGILPCGKGCDGLSAMLVLYPDSRYSLRTRKIGQDIKDKVKEGRFNWLPNGSQIRLSIEGEQNVINTLRVDHDQLMLLNRAGSVLTNSDGNVLGLQKTDGVPKPPPTF